MQEQKKGGFLGSSLFPTFKVQSDDGNEDDDDNDIDKNLYRSISNISDPAPSTVKKPSSFPSFPSFSPAPKFPTFSSFRTPEQGHQRDSRGQELGKFGKENEQHRSASPPKSKKRSREKSSHKSKEEKTKKKDKKRHQHDKEFDLKKADHDIKTEYWAYLDLFRLTKTVRIQYSDFKQYLKGKPINMARTIAAKKSTSEDDDVEFDDFIPLDQEALSKSKELQASESISFTDNPEYIKMTEEYNKKLSMNPKNRQTWIDFIKFQDSLVDSSAKKGLRAAVNDKKLAIYEKAFQHLPNDDELLAGYMTCCSETWETTRLLTKWDKVLKEHMGSFLLWDKYLEFRQTNYTTFSVANCMDVYSECISTLSQSKYLDEDCKENILTHIFIRACFMLFQSGFVERAICSFQAMIEFSAFCPPAFESQPFEQRVDMFESFWESECPRFGEENAIGWKESLLKDTPVDSSGKPPKTIPHLTALEGEDDFNKWFQDEMISDYRLWAPIRLSEASEEETEDPYRSVIFEDVRPIMFDCRLRSSKRRLLTSFLNLLSSQMNFGQSSGDRLTVDTFLHAELSSEACAAIFFPKKKDSESKDPLSKENEVVKFEFPLKTFPANLRNLIASEEYFGVMDKSEGIAIEASGDERKQFVNAMKIGKSLLKSERMNLNLWTTYAELEASKGNHEEALKIYQIALASYKTFPKEYQADAPSLHLSFAEYLFQGGQKSQAQSVLALLFESSGEQSTPVNPTRILRARKGYQDAIDLFTSSLSPFDVTQSTTNASSTISCFALFEYLLQGLEEGQAVFDKALEQLRKLHPTRTPPSHISYPKDTLGGSSSGIRILSATTGTPFEEILMELKVRLVYLHSKHGAGGFRPAILREVLEESLMAFPNHSGMLMLYLMNEARTKIENRMRRFLDILLGSEETHILWTFSIWAELHQRSNYNANAVRSLFERAVDSKSGRHSPSIWYLFILFEVISSSPPAKVKALFFRSIRECPWAKSLYMLAFGPLKFTFDPDELIEVHALMEEKELRVRCSF
ncbi:hypothetical protein HDU97_009906 [Phlyctochytrium planicorne]|nr:hypothetical protein HDU97_009906 [Phlyctochytrium planicorne]